MSEQAVGTIAGAVKKETGWYEGKLMPQDWLLSTKKGSIGEAMLKLDGKGAAVEFFVKQNGDFVNRYLDSIEASESAPASNGESSSSAYTKAKENPGTQRSIAASVALAQAVATLTHTITPAMTPKDVQSRVQPLAEAYFLWLADKAGVVEPDDIPFGD